MAFISAYGYYENLTENAVQIDMDGTMYKLV